MGNVKKRVWKDLQGKAGAGNRGVRRGRRIVMKLRSPRGWKKGGPRRRAA